MGKRDYFRLGDHNVICDRCGAKFKNSEMVDESLSAAAPASLRVCRWCKDKLNEQDTLKGIKDDQRATDVRARGTARFITTQITPEDL